MNIQHDMVNSDEHCRQCKGSGGYRERTERGNWAFETCHWCRGTGSQTIRIDEFEGEK